MMSTNEEVIRFIKGLPENVTLDDILEELNVRAKIEKGLRDLNTGKTVSHYEVKEKLSKWLS
jgi:predicted transcriptional regulator